MPDVLVPVCSKALLDRSPPVRSPADLQQLPLLHMASRAYAWPDWFKAAGVRFEGGIPDSAYGHFFFVIEEALHGNGVALVPMALAQTDIAAGRLVVPVDFPAESAGAYYVLCREHQADTMPIRVFREWLLSERNVPHPAWVREPRRMS
jgi:LysR family glycine cleavage system transcriptional activator